MLCSRFLRAHKEETHGRLYNLSERFFEEWLGLYERTLAWVMERRPAALVFSAVILIGTGLLFWEIPKGLFPTDDTGQLLVTTEAAEGVSFDGLVKAQAEIAETIKKDPDVHAVTSSVGTTPATNQGQLTIDLKPIDERKRSADQIATSLAAATATTKGITTYIENPPAISIGGLATKSLYQYTLEGGDINSLNSAATQLEARLRALPTLTDVTSDLLIQNPQVNVEIDREAAGRLGVSAAEIENTLYDAFGQRQVSTIYTSTNEYWVVLEVLPKFQSDIASLGSLYVRSTRGPVVPLSSVAKFTSSVGPVTVNHSGQIPAVTISFNLARGASLGPAVTAVGKEAAAVIPPTIQASFSGMAAAFMSTQQGLLMLLVLAVFVIYMILGVLYESFIHPITILTGLPFAAFGALVTLRVFGMDLDIYGFVGIIMLIGIVEEERDHDDRLRDRRGARAALVVGRRDHAGGERAVPPDHDDDDGGADGRAADRGRLGRGRGDAAAARRGGRGRSGVFTARDTVRNTRFLHVSRRTAALVRTVARDGSARRHARRCPNRPPCLLRGTDRGFNDALHQAAGHDDTRHGRDSRVRHRGVQGTARQRSAERRLPDDHRHGDAAGHAPQTMASTVATPLEKSFSTIAGIDNMTSTSSLGQSQIVVQFGLDRDINAAAQDVQAAITQTLLLLPKGIIPPSWQKTNPADAPILTLALTSPQEKLSTLDEYGETTIAQRLSMVGGVAQVLVYGTQKYAVRLQMDPAQLATRSIALEDVFTAVTNQNVNIPTGVLWGPKTALTIQATGQLDNAAEFKDMIITYRNGAPVYLHELGRIVDDVQNNKTASWYNGEPAIVLAIQRQPGTNTVDVSNRVKAELDKVKSDIPASVSVNILYDRSATIQASVHDVTFTLELTLALVVLIIFLFLRNVSATVIPSLALPMSIIGTFSVMYALHYSLDNLSLMALTLAVGFVVDDAIVMLENIVRHLEMGKTKMQAAVDGAKEVGFTILSMTFSLAAVFIPFLFMGGIIGKLFHEFAVTIGVAILVSGVVSLTLTPMLSSRFLRSGHDKKHGRLYQLSERFFDIWLGGYERSLAWVMQRRPAALAFSAVILVATGLLFWFTPKGLFPTDDTGQLLVTTEAAEGVSYDDLVLRQADVAAAIKKDPDVHAVTSSIGTLFAANQGQMTIDLKPIDERKRSADQIARDLTAATANLKDISTFIENPPAISIGGLATKSLYQYTLQGGDIVQLNSAATVLQGRLRALPQTDGRDQRSADQQSAGHDRHQSRGRGARRRFRG